MIMEVVPRDSNPVGPPYNIYLTILNASQEYFSIFSCLGTYIVIWAMIHVREELIMINPDSSRVLDRDIIIV